MARILVIPDSFKGSMSSQEICSVIDDVIKKNNMHHEIIARNVADGGEGSLDAIAHSISGHFVNVKCLSHLGREIQSKILISGNKAFIELALCCGLNLEKNNSILRASTYGLGQLILHAINYNVKEIVLCLGGSATNDMGLGMIKALGCRFFDVNGREIDPIPLNIPEIQSLDMSQIDSRIRSVRFTCMCDVENTLYGKDGAAYVFARQKGADECEVEFLDNALRHMSRVVTKNLGIDISLIKGSGAAGGTAAGALVFLNAKLQKGIDIILESIDFEHLAPTCDYIITGEGMLDSQSLAGKVVIGIARKNKELSSKTKVIAIVGGVEDSYLKSFESAGIYAIFPITRKPCTLNAAISESKANLEACVYNILKFI